MKKVLFFAHFQQGSKIANATHLIDVKDENTLAADFHKWLQETNDEVSKANGFEGTMVIINCNIIR